MPAYDYLCDACERRFERRQKMSEPALETCPKCGGPVHRLISGGAGAITGHTQAEMPSCGAGACCGMGGGCGQGTFCEN